LKKLEVFFVLFVDCSVGGGHAADALVSVGEPVQRHLSDAVVVNESSRNNQKMENLENNFYSISFNSHYIFCIKFQDQ
jgi:hypothetical protein